MYRGNFKKFAQFLAYSNLLIAVCASSLCLFTFYFFDFNLFVVETISFVFFSTLFTYLFHRKFDHIYYGNREITIQDNWSLKNKKTIDFLLIIAFILSFIFYWKLPKSTTLLLFPLLLISLLYVIRINIFGHTSTLRGIPYLKPFLIAFVWGGIASFLPIIVNMGLGSIYSVNYHMYCLSMSLFVFGQAIPLDIRDSIIDKKSELKTIPHLFGITGTKKISGFCYLTSILILLFTFENRQLFFLATFLSFAFSFFIIIRLKINNNELQYSFIHESSLAFPLICLKILFLF
jgi:4-hydroxybenzoate polyprenyltransferase